MNNANALDGLARALATFIDERVRVALERPAADIVSDASPDLPVPARKARQLAKAGAFPATKRGRRWFFRRADLLAHLSPGAAGPAPERTPDAVDALADSLGIKIGGAR